MRSISKSTILIFILALMFQPALADTELAEAQVLIAEGKLQEALITTDNYLARDKDKNGQWKIVYAGSVS